MPAIPYGIEEFALLHLCCIYTSQTNVLFTSSRGNIPISHLRSWINRKTKAADLLIPHLDLPPLVYLIS